MDKHYGLSSLAATMNLVIDFLSILMIVLMWGYWAGVITIVITSFALALASNYIFFKHLKANCNVSIMEYIVFSILIPLLLELLLLLLFYNAFTYRWV
jgi:hypothetical protein